MKYEDMKKKVRKKIKLKGKKWGKAMMKQER